MKRSGICSFYFDNSESAQTNWHFNFYFDIRVILSEILVGIIAIILFIQMLIADILWLKLLNGAVFILFCVFGYFLVKATIKEINLRKEIEKLSNTKSEFISIASHQLRTPLTAVKGYISMILEESYNISALINNWRMKKSSYPTTGLLLFYFVKNL